MTNRSPLVNPLLFRSLPNAFSRLLDIAHKTVTSDGFGDEEITYVSDPLMRGIRCYKEPVTGSEVRRADQTIVMQPFKLALAGYYPTILAEDAAIIEQTVYNIIAVDHDDTRSLTILTAEILNAAIVER